MNAISKTKPASTPALSEPDVIRILRNSLYPGATEDSVRLVLGWCKATGRDPMKRPVHVVPMWVTDAATGKGEMRDVLMPGIGTYRTDAANTGQYVGKSEPEFGPETTQQIDGMTVTFPLWCKMTVRRMVAGQVCDFPAKEYWIENYAAGKGKRGVNEMWRKRPYGQISKCTESQALRMAFPDETGNTYTAEEMAGRTLDGMTIEAEPQQLVQGPQPQIAAPESEPPAPPAEDRAREWADKLTAKLGALTTAQGLMRLVDATRANRDGIRDARPELSEGVEAAFAAAVVRLMPDQAPNHGAELIDDEIPF